MVKLPLCCNLTMVCVPGLGLDVDEVAVGRRALGSGELERGLGPGVVSPFVRGEFGDPKSAGSGRAVPMTERVADELRGLRGRSPYRAKLDLVFCHPESGKPFDRSKLVRRFKEAVARADFPEITFHELRHTFGTRMAAAGVPLRTIQHWMGHADSKTTQIYAHYQPSEHEVELVERAFG